MNQDEARTLPLVQRGKAPCLLFNFLLFAIMANLCCLAELPRFITFPAYPIYSLGLEIILSILLAVLGAAEIYLARRYFKARLNPLLLGAFSLLTLFAIIGTFATPETVTIPYGDHLIVTTTIGDKFVYALSSISGFFGLWILFQFGASGKRGRPYWFILYEGMVLFAVIAIAYSLFAEWNVYQAIFTSSSLSGDTAPVSWAGHKNAFGRYILVGIIAELYLLYLDRRYYRYATIAVLFFFLCLTMAKTPLILASALLLVFWIYMGILNYKKRRIASIVHLAFAGGALLLALILFLIPTESLGKIGSIIQAIKGNAEIGGGGTIDTRAVIWGHAIEVWKMNPVSMIFGYGDFTFGNLMSPAMDVSTYYPTAHNAALEALGRGGIARLIIEIVLLGYIAFRFVRAFQAKRKDVYLHLFVFLSLLVHAFFESEFVFDWTCEALCLTGMCVIPLFNEEADSLLSPRSKPTSLGLLQWPCIYVLFSLLPACVLLLCKIPLLPVSIPLAILSILAQGTLLYFSTPKDKRLHLALPLLIGNVLSISLGFAFPCIASFDIAGLFLFVWLVSFVGIFVPATSAAPFAKEMEKAEEVYSFALYKQQADN